jgi:hypothetical protein
MVRKALSQPVFSEPVPVFSEGTPTPDPSGFTTAHPSDDVLYKKIQSLLYLDAVGFPAVPGPPDAVYPLTATYGAHGPQVQTSLNTAGAVVFHAVGDTGASRTQNYPGELGVADHLSADCQTTDIAQRPAFLYLLGDLVYDFGEAQYYYDQFYEPFRNYPGPIFAIPGNHESFILPNTPATQAPLVTFRKNFCATSLGIAPQAGSLHRTAMMEPGVYFALDVPPYARIIGLFSNALEDPGVISSVNKKWPAVPDVQLAFLTAQLQRIKAENFSGAVLVATHHPPFTYAAPGGRTGTGAVHGGSAEMLGQIDQICAQVGVYPHAFLAGHAHNYQRYTRTLTWGSGTIQVPFVVCGSGGHDINLVSSSATLEAPDPPFGSAVDYLDAGHVSAVQPGAPLVLERYDQWHYGYLRIRVDPTSLTIGFAPVPSSTNGPGTPDSVTIELATHRLSAPLAPSISSGPPTRPSRRTGRPPARA